MILMQIRDKIFAHAYEDTRWLPFLLDFENTKRVKVPFRLELIPNLSYWYFERTLAIGKIWICRVTIGGEQGDEIR